MSPAPLRGQVWDVAFPAPAGRHPAVVLSGNLWNQRLSHVCVVPVTGTPGPSVTHLPLSSDAGLTRYPVSFADGTGVQGVARGRFRQQRGTLAPAEMAALERIVAHYLGLG